MDAPIMKTDAWQLENETSLALKSNLEKPEIYFLSALAILCFRSSGVGSIYIPVTLADTAGTAQIEIEDEDVTLADVVQRTKQSMENLSGTDAKPARAVQFCYSGSEQPNHSLTPTKFEGMFWHFRGLTSYRIDYAASQHRSLEVENLAISYSDILSTVLRDTTVPVNSIAFPRALEQFRSLQYPVDIIVEQNVPRNLIEAFQNTVALYREKAALVEGSLQLSYADVEECSSFIANKLRDHPNRNGTSSRFIAVCIPQSALAVVLFIAVLKLGNAYSPIDVRQAPERVASMLNSAGDPVLLVSKDSPDFLQNGKFSPHTIDVTHLLQDWQNSRSPSVSGHVQNVECGRLACLMFTSGTTGMPKGVRVTHENILTLAMNDEAVLVRDYDRVAQINNLAWDTIHLETWCPLLRGATVVCFNRFVILDPVAVRENFSTFEITAVFLSAALIRFYLSAEPDVFKNARLLHTGGETGRFEHYTQARSVNPGLIIQNSYGPMECSVYSTTRIMEPSADLPPTGNVPIGLPLKSAQVLLLDAHGQLVPPGIIGEIWISGKHVSEGYEGREEESSAAFRQVQVPGLHKSPCVFYRTGDRGRWNADGEMEFCGRINFNQIKIRGQRMELTDIETSIAGVLGVKDVAVGYYKPEGQPDGVLMGYIVPGTTSHLQKEMNQEDVTAVTQEWERFYGVIENMPNARQDFTGWNSAISKEAFLVDEMEAFLQDTLRPFKKIKPRKALEVGCGNGIIACRLAEDVEEFYGMELTENGVKVVEQQLQDAGMASKSKIWAGAADQLSSLPEFDVDFIMINSVIQYFPSIDYLEDVIRECIRRSGNGGHIVIGDIRSAPLDDMLAVDMAKHEWGDSWANKTVGDLRQAATRYQDHDKELLVDPAYFFHLKSRCADITHVEVFPKHFSQNNELSRYRYQAVLHVKRHPNLLLPVVWNGPAEDDPYFESLPNILSEFLTNDGEQILAFEGIPYSLVTWQRSMLEKATNVHFDTASPLGSIAGLDTQPKGWSAAELETLALQRDLHVKISFARQHKSSYLDTIFTKKALPPDTFVLFPEPRVSKSRWQSTMANSAAYKRTKIRGKVWDTIIRSLRSSLPDYMIPQASYVIGSVPLTANSKVDRARLNEMAKADFESDEASYVAPTLHRNEVEGRLSGIFQTLLGGNVSISPSTDFFSSGGHSLLAMKLRYAIQTAFKVNVPLAEIFEAPTPEGLAKKISRLSPTQESGDVSMRVKRLNSTISELSFPQLRMWFMYQMNPDSVDYNSGFCYQFHADVDVEAIEKTIHALATRHDCMRMIFFEENGVPKSEVTHILPTLEQVHINDTSEDELKTLIREYCYRPYNLRKAPPIRATLFRRGVQSFLLMGMHHIITDGSSVELWTREMERTYPAIRFGSKSPLQKLPWSYQDFAVWQRSEDFELLIKSQLEYWKVQLDGSQPCRIPADYPVERSGLSLNSSKRMIATIDEELKRKLHSVCRKYGVTWFMLLGALIRAVQFQLTGQLDGSFCFPNANRRRAEVAEVSGLFVNTQVLRLKCNENILFSELLQHSRTTSLEAFSNEDVPFDRLVKELNPARTYNQNPLGEIMFAYQNFDFWSFDMGEIPVTMYPYWAESTRFDLELQWFDYGETMQCELNYRDSVYSQMTIQKIIDRMMGLLDAVANGQDPVLKSDSTHQDVPTYLKASKTSQYWSASLDGHVSLKVPTDSVRPKDLGRPDRSMKFTLDDDTRFAMVKAAERLEVSVHGLLVSVYGLILGAYANQDDIILGVQFPADPRDGEKMTAKDAVLPLRFSLDKSDTSIEFSQKVTQHITAAFEHLVSFDDLLRELRIERSSTCHPIFRHALTFSKSSALASANLDLLSSITETEGEYTFELMWPSALFSADTISEMARTFLHVLLQLASKENLGRSVASLDFASDYTIIKSDELSSSTDQESLADIFVEAARRDPEADALVCGDQRSTYASLDAKSNQMANYLHDIGVRLGDAIGLLFTPCIDMIVNVVALWKLGAAYVPLSNEWPLSRVTHVLEDANISILLTHRGMGIDLSSMMEHIKIQYLDDEDVQMEIAQRDSHFTVSHISNSATAYYIYTSGTTGMPKGVVVPQKGVIAFANDIRDRYFGPHITNGISKLEEKKRNGNSGDSMRVSADRHHETKRIFEADTNAAPNGIHQPTQESIPLVSPLVFDFSVEQIMLSIFSGNKLVLLPNGLVADDEFYEYLRREKITYMSGSTSVISQLDLARLVDLHHVTIGGEQCTSAHLRRIRKGFHKRLTNIYGTTETTVYNMVHEIQGEYFSNSIGRPIAGHNLYVSNAHFQKLPQGAIGELFVSGPGVTDGYIRRPELTQEKFLQNPFGQFKGHNIVYRTGDSVLMLPNGTLGYIGRSDKQVQLHGIRVELDEIQQTLAAYPDINESVVLAKSQGQVSSSSVNYLVGYYTSAETIGTELVKAYLAARLPPTYIPQFLVQVPDKLPTTISGKLDTARLPEVETQNGKRLERKPRNDLEADLCRIWSSSLDTEVFIDDDFFRIGGDSIIAIRLVHEQNKHLSPRIQVRDIFLYPTVAKLTTHMATFHHTAVNGENSTVPNNKQNSQIFIPYVRIVENPRSGPILHVFPPGAGGAESYYRTFVPTLANTPIVAYNNVLLHNPDERATYENLAHQYITWLKEVQPKGPYHLFGWSFGGLLAFEISIQLARAGEKVASLTLLDPYFDARRIAQEVNIDGTEVLAPIHIAYSPKRSDTKILEDVLGRVFLFKSPLINEFATDKVSKRFFERYQDATFNGLDAFLATGKIEVITLEGAGHYDWIKKSEAVEKVAEVVVEALRLSEEEFGTTCKANGEENCTTCAHGSTAEVVEF